MNDALPQKSKDTVHNIYHDFNGFSLMEEFLGLKIVG